jgi:hypothetical protein
MEVVEYLYYEGTLIVSINTPRAQPQPASVFTAGTIHAEFIAKVRSALREFRTTENLPSGLSAYLPQSEGKPLYGIRKMAPAGSPRSVDPDFNIETTSARFSVGLSLYPSTFLVADEIAFAIERNVEKAAQDLFKARGIPYTTIPGDNQQLADSFIDIMFDLGPATEQGLVNVTV